MSKKTVSKIELRAALHNITPIAQLSMADSVKQMRQVTGKTQIEFAKLIGIAPRIIINIENEKGNPTLDTLNKIGKLFGFGLGFVRGG